MNIKGIVELAFKDIEHFYPNCSDYLLENVFSTDTDTDTGMVWIVDISFTHTRYVADTIHTIDIKCKRLRYGKEGYLLEITDFKRNI